jgi:hypothetical protein
MPVCRRGTVRSSTVPKPTSPTAYQHFLMKNFENDTYVAVCPFVIWFALSDNGRERFSSRYFGLPISATFSQCAMLLFNSSATRRHIILVTDIVVKHTNSLRWISLYYGILPPFHYREGRECHNNGPHSKDSTCSVFIIHYGLFNGDSCILFYIP